MTPYHPTVDRIKDLLEQHHVSYTTFEHAPVRTSEEAAALRPEYTLAQGAKALIVKVTPRSAAASFIQVVVPGDQKFDTKKVKTLLDAKDLRFATPAEVATLTAGIEPGGVPPFGNLFGLSVIVDASLYEHDDIIFNAGDRRYSIAIKSTDHRRVIEPLVANIV